jgi:4-amino-4-deoxy-L-arabinose transferase-like glycosyltransferase
MENKKIYILLLIFIFALGILLRLWMLGSIPQGFFRDEAAISYNAYSIWQTGKDEYGVSYPLVFRSFEVFFLPLYIYITAPIVGIFGLNVVTSRILSAVSGIGALFFVYLIGKKLWGKTAAIFSLLVLAISPWHIFYSRGTFEGNAALTLFTAGFYFWTKFTEDRSKYPFFASTLLFALSMYSYQAERVVVPLVAVCALLLNKEIIFDNLKRLVTPILAVLIILIPLISLSFKAGGYHRAFGVSFFSQQSTPPGWVESEPAGIFVNNKFYLRSREFLALYLSYFSPKNLFLEGDSDLQRSVDDFGVMYAWMLPFLFYGLISVMKKLSKNKKLLLAWALFAPLPAALTSDPFHTYRSLLLYIPLTLLTGNGLGRAYEVFVSEKQLSIGRNLRKLSFAVFIVALSTGSLSAFLFNYVFISQTTRARNWDYGYKQMVDFIGWLPAGTRVVVDDPGTEGYIHYLFYNSYDPISYQRQVASLRPVMDYYYSNPDEIRPNLIDNIEFRPVDWPTERGDTGTVFVMWYKLLPDSEFVTDPKVKLLNVISYPDGTPAYKIVTIL